jgi:hypothetical protein
MQDHDLDDLTSYSDAEITSWQGVLMNRARQETLADTGTATTQKKTPQGIAMAITAVFFSHMDEGPQKKDPDGWLPLPPFGRVSRYVP